MSARLITLAVNIAVMGFLLVEQIARTLRSGATEPIDAAQQRAMAETLAAGDTGMLAMGLRSSGAPGDLLVQHSIADGFGLVMFYGGIGAWILAGLSFVLFRTGRATPCPRAPSATKAALTAGGADATEVAHGASSQS